LFYFYFFIDEEAVVKLWALNQKTIALRDKMHEKMKKYWQSQHGEGDEYGDGYDDDDYNHYGATEKIATPPTRNKETSLDRYKGEITKLERSMKAVQHQRYNARR
jgi:hypothetical protein